MSNCDGCRRWRTRYESMASRVMELEEELLSSEKEILYHKEVNENLEQAFLITKMNMQNAIRADNETRQTMAKEIEILREKIKLLEG